MHADNPADIALIAVIEIGSSTVRMRVAQTAGGTWRELEVLERPVRIGHEVFSSRRIGFESVALLSRILADYSQVMREYGVARVRTLATTALREAENRDDVVDLIRVRNGIAIEVLEGTRESAMVIDRILSRDRDTPAAPGTLLAYLGTGSITLAYARDNRVQLTASLPTGIQRLAELLPEIQNHTGRYHDALRDYVRTLLAPIQIRLDGQPLDRLIVNGRAALRAIFSAIHTEQAGELMRVDRHALAALRAPSTAPHSRMEHGDAVLPVWAVTTELLAWTRADHLLFADFDLSDTVLDEMVSRANRARSRETSRLNALASARFMAAAFHCDMTHADWVARHALLIFEALRKPHGLGRRARMLLELSAWLHDVGSFVNTRDHRTVAFEILRYASLFGVGEEDLLLVACIAGFDESDPGGSRFRLLPFAREKDRLLAVKLSAILQLANAMDQSHTQRLQNLRCECTDDRLLLRCDTAGEAALEHWAVSRWSPAFEDIFGIQPALQLTSVLLP